MTAAATSTAPAARVRGLDGLRGIAAYLVMTYHVEAGRRRLLGTGQTAMEIFFVLSGFVITRSLLLERSGIDLRRFYVRRAFRLVPALVVFLAVSLLLTHFWQGAVPSNLWWMAGGALAYCSNVVLMTLHGGVGVFGGLWSLSIEEQFYLVWPFVLRLLLRCRLRVVYTVIGLAAVASLARRAMNLAPGASENWAAYGTDARALGLLLGCLGAVASVRAGPLLARPPVWVLDAASAAATAAIVCCCVLVTRYVPRTFLTWWLLAPVASLVLVVVLSHERQGWAAKFYGNPGVVALGKISYSLYLWHFFVVSILEPWGIARYHLGALGRYVVLATLSVLIATLSYLVIERPLVRMGRAVSSRHPARPGRSLQPEAIR